MFSGVVLSAIAYTSYGVWLMGSLEREAYIEIDR
ncbi:MAG: hypothetical protein AWU55_1086 [Halomonadaceae bacterium T82-2]|nr:MAG: hypothetical protein AWU55_1086 [Halomonadaceae bacterium T82-2]